MALEPSWFKIFGAVAAIMIIAVYGSAFFMFGDTTVSAYAGSTTSVVSENVYYSYCWEIFKPYAQNEDNWIEATSIKFVWFGWETTTKKVMVNPSILYEVKATNSMYFSGVEAFSQYFIIFNFEQPYDAFIERYFWSASEIYEEMSPPNQQKFKNAYNDYLYELDLEVDDADFDIDSKGYSTNYVKLEKNAFQIAWEYLGKIPEGVDTIEDVVGFNLKDQYGEQLIPSDIKFIFQIVMAPVWIIFIVGLLVFFVSVVEAVRG